MKQILTLGLAMMLSVVTFAQLGAPKTTVKDTLYIVGCIYNGTTLDYNDWPAKYIVEDAVNIYIANYTYKKGKPKSNTEINTYNLSWEGHIDYYSYDATCNGKKSILAIVKPREDCNSEFYGKYIIDDYSFYVVTQRQWNGNQ